MVKGEEILSVDGVGIHPSQLLKLVTRISPTSYILVLGTTTTTLRSLHLSDLSIILNVGNPPSRNKEASKSNMSTQLLEQFPSLSTHPPAFLKDLLSSPALTEAFLFSLPEIQQLAAEVEQLGKENEEMARK
jgi:hypothetical protein